ncbi:DUF4291 domain-containing protein [Taibaiella chishuiensis]|uniref:Uncharacterized protein DUF4291 n=1 Tax=Taibaiella chishuiensis TaxID=1434707 RepID=A0A2P8DAR5_9BACT|nr:DUF4291 domain-containing protein [Taibaiella chishuiensis]PSK94313.1 uncharacterized protein DUF4291 [Taibaiella chishuiensis]
MKTIPYAQLLAQLPENGKHITGYQDNDQIVVYQAYKPAIAEYAVRHQQLGGPGFSYERMSWIKPGFLWMMYRCGWATKEDQESVLAITIAKTDFLQILAEAVPTTFKPKQYSDSNAWKADMKAKAVRLQWDPDHDPFGRKQERRAIQLGLKGDLLKTFGQTYIRSIADITGFVKEQKVHVDRHRLEALLVPAESVMTLEDPALRQAAGL